MSRLIGAWQLTAWRRTGSDGSVTYPLGENVRGLIVYTANGHMIVQMTTAGRAQIDSTDPLGGDPNQRAGAYSTCLAYFGTYEVSGQQVTHHIEASLFPNWSATTAVRPFEIDGDRLVLRTPPSPSGDITIVNEMSWVRSDSARADPASQGAA